MKSVPKTVFSRRRQKTLWLTQVIRYKFPSSEHNIKKLLFLNYILLCAQSVMVLSNMLLLYVYNSLTAWWINGEVKCASSLFRCQEALVFPSIVNLIEEIFMKWKIHQEKCWAIVSDNVTNAVTAMSDLRITNIPHCLHSSAAYWESYYGTELLPVVTRDAPLFIILFHPKINYVT